MPVKVEARPLPDHPGAVAYQITGPSRAAVAHAVALQMDEAADNPPSLAEFYTPRLMPDGAWQTRGYVMGGA